MQKADLVHPGEIKEQKNINIMEDKSHLRKYLQHEAMPLVKKEKCWREQENIYYLR